MIEAWATPKGPLRFAFRPETNDWNTISAIVTHDEYGFREQTWSGTAIDVGAHIGAATVVLLHENPDLTVVAIEALPENVGLIERSLELNGYSQRCEVIAGAADSGMELVGVRYGSTASEFERLHYFIGGGVWNSDDSANILQPPVSLSSIVDRVGPISLLKIDCEGCEWSFLDDPAIPSVTEIRGEFHPRNGMGPARLHELLDDTHLVIVDDALGFGPFRATLR